MIGEIAEAVELESGSRTAARGTASPATIAATIATK